MGGDRQVLYILLGVLSILVIIAIAIVIPLVILLPERPEPPEKISFPISDVPMGVYKKAAVACDNGYCSTVGKQILEKGGHAVDATIAAMFCNGVVNMQNLGIGGGGFTVAWDSKTRSAHALDAYGAAPLGTSEEVYLNNPDASLNGKYAVAVPGHFAMVFELHRRFGRLSWAELVQPSVDLCENGFQIGPAFAFGIDWVRRLSNLTTYPEEKPMVEYLTDPSTGHFYKLNDIIKCPALANTLRLIGKDGPMSFYNGTLSELARADFAELGIPITREDLLSYRVVTRKPFEMTLPNGLTVYTPRPGSSGAVAAFTLNVLAGYKFGPSDAQDPQAYYRYVEASNFAFAQLWFVGGQETPKNEAVMEARLSKMESSQYGEQLRLKINETHRLPPEQYVRLSMEGGPESDAAAEWATQLEDENSHHSTSHISVMDEEGNAVSMTTTLFRYFGSYVMGPRTGIVFNNQIANFGFRNSSKLTPPNNYFEPGKRPMTMVSPTIVVDRSASEPESAVKLVIGASGSKKIVTSVPYVAMRALWFGETAKEAVDALRISANFQPEFLYYENITFPQHLLTFFGTRGYPTRAAPDRLSGVCQVIQRLPNGTLLAMSDFRKELGYTDGY